MFQFNWLTSLSNRLRAGSTRRIKSQRKHSRLRSFREATAFVSRTAAERLEDRTLLTVFTVVNTNDSGTGSLREAIELANVNVGADTISFDAALAGQTIILDSELLISDDLTINGLGADQLTLDASGDNRIFNINDGDAETTINVDISGLTMTNGYAENGGAILNHENLSVFSSTISKNKALKNGGGIYHAAGLLTINETTFAENLANESGGGIYNSTQDLVVSKSTFYRNVATKDGGGIYTLQGVSKYKLREQPEPQIRYRIIPRGGDISLPTYEIVEVIVLPVFLPKYDLEFNSITITDTSFTENSAMNGGGLFSNYTKGPSPWWIDVILYSSITNENSERIKSEFTIVDSAFTGNTAVDDGGGIFNLSGLLEIRNSSISNNSAVRSGGGIKNHDRLTIKESTVSDNIAGSKGGGISNYHNLYIEKSTISNNTALVGGGIEVRLGSLTFKHSTLNNNIATSNGGGIYSLDGNVSIKNSTISKNHAGGLGGGIYSSDYFISDTVIHNPSIEEHANPATTNEVGSPELNPLISTTSTLVAHPINKLEITNSTITGNSAEQSGGGIVDSRQGRYSEETTITNSIVAGNTAATFPQIEGNYIGNTNIIQDSIDGLLDPVLRDNGGPSKTHTLLAGSAAINAGDNDAANAAGLTNDQRGTGSARIIDGTVDIGAFEVQAPFTQIDLRVVNSKTPTSVNGERTSLPENLTWIDEWGNYWVEIWISSPSTTDLGIFSANLNFTYNTDITTATSIEYGAAFTENQTGTINDLSGTIENLSAETSTTDVGDDQYLLFARIKFESTSNDAIDLNLQGQGLNSQSPDFLVKNSEIRFVGDFPSEELHGPSPTTQIWANPFDINDDDKINFRDLILFVSTYNSITSESSSNFSWLTDLDNNNRVNFKDLFLFARNYGKSKLDQSAIVYPQFFHEYWIDLLNENTQTGPLLIPVTVITVDKTIDSPNEHLDPQVVDLEGDTISPVVLGTIRIDINSSNQNSFVESTIDEQSIFDRSSQLSLIELSDPDQDDSQLNFWSAIDYELRHEDEGVVENPLSPKVRRHLSGKLNIDLEDNSLPEEPDSFFLTIQDQTNLVPF
ncbi:choice-of-anchor Q domain-containing protein [Gimesia aquarii]|uniref:Putative outer membrane protein PmpB n=1 Tax=Gimesia aquarii TaxID=2527964 RepID=A0A517X320_9PLAN|nr:choice-of-anchor Q domain-containing protein [Gimesia aquarii]QDU11904.1 putative outer membrane protein PmpB precursor [Gimesia aquarii]